MKTAILVLLATLAVSSNTFAGEEINVAAAIGAGASTTTTTSFTSGSAADATVKWLATGVIVAGLVAIVGGTSSTTNH